MTFCEPQLQMTSQNKQIGRFIAHSRRPTRHEWTELSPKSALDPQRNLTSDKGSKYLPKRVRYHDRLIDWGTSHALHNLKYLLTYTICAKQCAGNVEC